MANLLYRIGKWCFRAKWAVIVAWVMILAVLGGASALLQQGFNDIFTIKNTPAQRATELYLENFPELKSPMDSAGVNIVFKAPEGETLEDPKNSAAIDEVISYLEDHVDGITGTERFGNPITLNPKLQQGIIDAMVSQGLPEENARADAENLSLVSEDKRYAFTTFELDVPLPANVTDEQRAGINGAMDLGREKGLTVEGGGPGFGDPIVIKSTSEIVGLSVAAVVLIFTFGSLVAAGMPLIVAVVGVGIGALATVLATAWVPLNNVTPVLAVMLGLAVGIDYSLFIIFRYSKELARMSRKEAAGMAVGTAGSAVVFAGLTVIIALVALSVANIPFLTYMGFSAAFTVLMAVLVALTLVPAILGALGEKSFAGQPKALKRRQEKLHSGAPTMGERWVKFVHRFPGLIIAGCVVALGALTVPVGDLHLSLPMDTLSNRDTTQRKQADLMAEGFGEGVNSPFLVVIDAHDVDADAAALRPLVDAQRPAPGPETGSEADPEVGPEEGPEFDKQQAATFASYMYVLQKFAGNMDVKHVQLVGISQDGRAAQMLLTPKKAPQDPATNELIKALLIQEEEIRASTGIDLGITGLVPIQQDVTNRLASVMPLYLGIVVGLAVLLLMIIFRSLLIPLVAGAGFLLSVGAAFGVTVLFWQEGLWGLVNTPGPIIAFMPIFLIGVCFGLAMDYQVFLVSAMREHYTHTGGKAAPGSLYNGIEESVIVGFTRSARVVTAAALIMIAVFVAFIGQPLPFVKIFGFALAAGVLFDAFVVRMAFLPAAMFIMGRGTWWMPRWLDKILPSLDVEGAKLEEKWSKEHPEESKEFAELN